MRAFSAARSRRWFCCAISALRPERQSFRVTSMVGCDASFVSGGIRGETSSGIQRRQLLDLILRAAECVDHSNVATLALCSRSSDRLFGVQFVSARAQRCASNQDLA